MRLTVNGESREVPEETTVAGLLDLLGLSGRPLAVERNREIVPRSERHDAERAVGSRETADGVVDRAVASAHDEPLFACARRGAGLIGDVLGAVGEAGQDAGDPPETSGGGSPATASRDGIQQDARRRPGFSAHRPP